MPLKLEKWLNLEYKPMENVDFPDKRNGMLKVTVDQDGESYSKYISLKVNKFDGAWRRNSPSKD